MSYTLPFDNISPLLIYVGRSHCVFIGRAFGQWQWSYGQVSEATSVSPAFPVFPVRTAGFCRLDTEQRLTAVTLEGTATCILQSFGPQGPVGVLCVSGIEVFGPWDWSDADY